MVFTSASWPKLLMPFYNHLLRSHLYYHVSKLTKQTEMATFWTACSTAQHSSGYKPIFLDSMELVAIEQASSI